MKLQKKIKEMKKMQNAVQSKQPANYYILPIVICLELIARSYFLKNSQHSHSFFLLLMDDIWLVTKITRKKKLHNVIHLIHPLVLGLQFIVL